MVEVNLTLTRDEFLALMKLTLLNAESQRECIRSQHGEDILDALEDVLVPAYQAACPTAGDVAQLNGEIREIIQICMRGGYEDSGLNL